VFAGINRRFSVYPVSVREWKPEFLAVFLRLKGQMMRAKSFTHAVRADARATREQVRRDRAKLTGTPYVPDEDPINFIPQRRSRHTH